MLFHSSFVGPSHDWRGTRRRRRRPAQAPCRSISRRCRSAERPGGARAAGRRRLRLQPAPTVCSVRFHPDWGSRSSIERVAHVALAVGTDQPLTLDNRLHVCPVATATYARRQGSAAAGAGGHVTLRLGRSQCGGSDGRAVSSVRRAITCPTARPTRDPLEHAAEIQAAIGFILRGRLAVTPRVMFARRRPATMAVELTFDAR